VQALALPAVGTIPAHPTVLERSAVPERINGAAITPRQREVVALIADGLTDREMAATLSIGIETLKSHVRAIKLRTKARNRAHLVALAFRET